MACPIIRLNALKGVLKRYKKTEYWKKKKNNNNNLTKIHITIYYTKIILNRKYLRSIMGMRITNKKYSY